jgi:acyl dehydratase
VGGLKETAPGESPPAVISTRPRRFSEADMAAYAALTHDFNPIHLDSAFAAQTSFGGMIAYGTLLLAPIWEAMEEALGRQALNGARAEVKFLRPIKVGSTPKIEGRLVETLSSDLQYEFTIRTEEGDPAATCTLTLPPG